MKVMCLVSSSPGHLGFGGLGYLRLASSLMSHGHKITWIAPPNQKSKLLKQGFQVIEVPILDSLRLRPLLVASENDSVLYRNFVTQYIWLKDQIKQANPDVLLIDRILPIGGLIADELCITHVAIGTPGGFWKQVERSVHPCISPVAHYEEISWRLKSDLKWNNGDLQSTWCSAAQLNICFMGKSFYNQQVYSTDKAIFINNFLNAPSIGKRNRYAISLSAGAPVDDFKIVISSMQSECPRSDKIEVFSGLRKDAINAMGLKFDDRVNIHDWVNFSDFFPYLKLLVLQGGVGTIWDCVNFEVPMLIIPGGVGDQQVNADAIDDLGLGISIGRAGDIITPDMLRKSLGKLSQHSVFQQRIQEFKNSKNYTDTLETVVDKIENMHHMEKS